VTPAGDVNHDLTDFSDFFATFAELAGAPLPEGVTLDSRSFAPQIKGEKGTPRDWVYVELNGNSYVRNARYKLTNKGELFDLSEAPYKEILVASEANVAARKQLQTILDQHPAAAGKDLTAKKAAKAAKKKARKGL
jgi:arylsulfatase A